MAKYGKNDCRNSAGLGKTVSDYPKMFLSAPVHNIHNRHEKRTSAHFSGRKNTRGFELGFNATTWADYCQERALANTHKA